APFSSPDTGDLPLKNVLAGGLFIAVAVLGLWLSRNYRVGTATSMGTGYVPRLLCWSLAGLGGIVLLQGLIALAHVPEKWAPVFRKGHAQTQDSQRPWHGDAIAILRPLVCVAASLVAFALALPRLGLVVAILLLVGIGSLAQPE